MLRSSEQEMSLAARIAVCAGLPESGDRRDAQGLCGAQTLLHAHETIAFAQPCLDFLIQLAGFVDA